MTRWDNKIWKRNGYKDYRAPNRSVPGQRYLKRLMAMQTNGTIVPHSGLDNVDTCPVCGIYCLGMDWPKHRGCFDPESNTRVISSPEQITSPEVIYTCERIAGIKDIKLLSNECMDCGLIEGMCPISMDRLKEYLKAHPGKWVYFKKRLGIKPEEDKDICIHCGKDIHFTGEVDEELEWEFDDNGDPVSSETVLVDKWVHIVDGKELCEEGDCGAYPTKPMRPLRTPKGDRTYIRCYECGSEEVDKDIGLCDTCLGGPAGGGRIFEAYVATVLEKKYPGITAHTFEDGDENAPDMIDDKGQGYSLKFPQPFLDLTDAIPKKRTHMVLPKDEVDKILGDCPKLKARPEGTTIEETCVQCNQILADAKRFVNGILPKCPIFIWYKTPEKDCEHFQGIGGIASVCNGNEPYCCERAKIEGKCHKMIEEKTKEE